MIAEAESTNIKQNKLIEGLQKRLETLAPRAEQADAYKDQADENRHLQERVRKLEGSNDKYKKRLEELVVLKNQLQALEEQNISLLDERGVLLEDNKKTQALRSQTEQSTMQISALEADIQHLKARNEGLELRIAELLTRAPPLTPRESVMATGGPHQRFDAESAHADSAGRDGVPEDVDDIDTDVLVDPELSLAADELLSAEDDLGLGRTTADLKLEIRNLRRQLAEQQMRGDSQRSATPSNDDTPSTSEATRGKSPAPSSQEPPSLSSVGDEADLRAQVAEVTRKLHKARAVRGKATHTWFQLNAICSSFGNKTSCFGGGMAIQVKRSRR